MNRLKQSNSDLYFLLSGQNLSLPLVENKTLIALDSENKIGFLQDDELKRGIGDNPFPALEGDNLKTFETAYSDALKQFESKDVGKQCKECLAKEKQSLPDLAELVKKMSKGNVFDGRKSTLAIEKKKKDFYRIKELFSDKKDQIAAMVVPLQTKQGEIRACFLNHYFFNPDGAVFPRSVRAILLMHEAVHQFGKKSDSDFGGSEKLTELIASKCYPAANAAHLLGKMTL